MVISLPSCNAVEAYLSYSLACFFHPGIGVPLSLTECKFEKGKPGSLEVFEIQHRPESVSCMIDSGKAIRLEL